MPRPGYYYYRNLRAQRAFWIFIPLALLFAAYKLADNFSFDLTINDLLYWLFDQRYLLSAAILIPLIWFWLPNFRKRRAEEAFDLVHYRSEQPLVPPDTPELTEQATLAPITIPHNLHQLNPIVFEKIFAHVLRLSNYRVVELGGSQPDGGIDLIVDIPDQSPLGVQCKKYWQEQIGVNLLREFLGALKDGGYKSGIFATLKGFTEEAKAFAQRNDIELWDQKRIGETLDLHKVSYCKELAELLASVEPNCPDCAGGMTLRRARQGPYAGLLFWGCRRRWCDGLRPFSDERERVGA